MEEKGEPKLNPAIAKIINTREIGLLRCEGTWREGGRRKALKSEGKAVDVFLPEKQEQQKTASPGPKNPQKKKSF